MSAESKRQFCREWFARGECPGCGAPLAKVAGAPSLRHFLRDQIVICQGGEKAKGRYRIPNRPPTRQAVYSRAGDPASGVKDPNDPRLCRFTADDLTSLVLIATDFGRSVDCSGASQTSPPERSTERPTLSDPSPPFPAGEPYGAGVGRSQIEGGAA